MIIEFSNVRPASNHSLATAVITVSVCIFFFVPVTLIVLGYYTSQPTGSLISPLPSGVISNQNPTSSPTPSSQPIIAAPNSATTSAEPEQPTSQTESNLKTKTAVIEPGTTETTITDPDITANSRIFLSAEPGDKAVYYIKSKTVGEFLLSVNEPSDSARVVDYHLVNP